AVRHARDARLVREARAFDDERVAVPVAAAVAEVLHDGRVEMRTAVERDDPCLVDHLVRDRDGVGALPDHDAVAVEHGAHAGRETARDAAVVKREVLERVERAVAESALPRDGLTPRAARGRDGRRAAVRRVDDERRETEAAYAPRVTVKRLDVLRMLAAGLLAPRALYELLLVEKLLRTERCRPVEWNRAHVVRGPRARE